MLKTGAKIFFSRRGNTDRYSVESAAGQSVPTPRIFSLQVCLFK